MKGLWQRGGQAQRRQRTYPKEPSWEYACVSCKQPRLSTLNTHMCVQHASREATRQPVPRGHLWGWDCAGLHRPWPLRPGILDSPCQCRSVLMAKPSPMSFLTQKPLNCWSFREQMRADGLPRLTRGEAWHPGGSGKPLQTPAQQGRRTCKHGPVLIRLPPFS